MLANLKNLRNVGSLVTSLIAQPFPLRFQIMRLLDSRLDVLSYPSKIKYGVLNRSNYGYCLLEAAKLAARLGHKKISAIEFGVAGGNGLVAMEKHAKFVEKELGVSIQIYGFDSGVGMPPPIDYRDMPYLWQAGNFRMDVDKLKARLTSAKLCLGPVEETVGNFCEREQPAPIGFIAIDLDYYSSTKAALEIFRADHNFLLPRVVCYLDDVVGGVDWAFSEYAGELLAIKEFNAENEHMKIAPPHGLRFANGHLPMDWHDKVFVAHRFNHPDYGRPVTDTTQLPLRG